MRAVREAEIRLLQSQDARPISASPATPAHPRWPLTRPGSRPDVRPCPQALPAARRASACGRVAEGHDRDKTIHLPIRPDMAQPPAGYARRRCRYANILISTLLQAEFGRDMLAALRTAKSGDVVLLHGCCYNPTGANLEAAQWPRSPTSSSISACHFVDIAIRALVRALRRTPARGSSRKSSRMVVASELLEKLCRLSRPRRRR